MKVHHLPFLLFRILVFFPVFALGNFLDANIKHTSCTKITSRVEWRSMSEVQRGKWISSVKCLGSIKHRRLSYTAQGALLNGTHSIYDDFSYTHNAMQKSAHSNPYFLPWHRWFLYLFDTALREICGYAGPTPYWNWSQDSYSLLDAPVFDPSPIHGLGESGECSQHHDCTITSGALVYPFFLLSFPVPHVLRRNLSLNTWADLGGGAHNETIGKGTVNKITSSYAGDFFRFQYKLTMMHNHIHNFVGGDLAGLCPLPLSEEECENNDYTGYTPNDPIFWLHHAQLDRIWSNWQASSSRNFHSFSGLPANSKNLSDPRYDLNASSMHIMGFDHLSVGVRVLETFDHRIPPFCYTYE